MSNKPDNAELRKEIIALGEKGLHRALLATYAPEILNLITAKLEEVSKEAECYQTVLGKQFKIHEHLLKVIETKDKMIASLKGGDV